MADDSLDFSALNAPAELDFSAAKLPEEGATAVWGGRNVSVSAIKDTAEKNGVSPESIMRLDTWPGRVEDWMAKSVVGDAALHVSEGLQGVADTAVSGVARAVGRPDIARNVAANRQQRQEFLGLIEKGGDTQALLGERGSRIFNGATQGATEMGLVGVAKAPLAVYAYMAGSEFEHGMDDGEAHGLQGSDLVGYAGRRGAIMGGLSLLMGKAAGALGATTLEESMSPAANNAIKTFLDSPAMKSKLVAASKGLGGMAAEGVEQMMISGASQANDLHFGVRDKFSWDELLDAGGTGVAMRSLGAIRELHSALDDFAQKKLPDVAAGTKAASVDIERGVNPYLTKDIVEGPIFDRETGRNGTTPQFRDSYRDAANHYLNEARNNGDIGSLERLEKDALAVNEEERQRTARIAESKSKAAAAKENGAAGESQAKVEPVTPEEQPALTANERAAFNLKDYDTLVANPHIGEALTQPESKVNPYILAPWESQTREQRRIATLSQQVAEHKDTIKGLWQAVVDNKRLTFEQQQSALDLVRQNIPSDEQHKFFQGVIASTKPSAINKLLDRVSTYTEQRDHNLAVQGLKQSLQKATNLRPEFGTQVQELKSSIDLKRFRNRDVAETLKQWATDNPHAIVTGKESDLLARLEQQNVHGMTADDVRALSTHVESLAYQSKAKDRLIGNQESASIRDTSDAIVREIAQSPRREMRSDSRVELAKANMAGEEIAPHLSQERTLGSKAMNEIATRPEITLQTLSPELNNQIYEPIRRARSQYKLREAATRQLMADTFNSVGLTHENSLVTSLKYRAGLPSTPLENWRSQEREINGVKMNRGEALWLALSSRDPDGMANLMAKGAELESGKRTLPPVNALTLAHLFDFIGPEGEKWVDASFDHLNTFVIDGVNETNTKMTGRPLTNKTNVVPMFLADDEYTKLVSKGRSGIQEAVADSYGHLKHREGGERALKIPADMDGIDMLMSHADRMHRFASYGVQARNAEMLLNDPELKSAIHEKNGSYGFNSIVDAVKAEVVGYPSLDGVTRGLAALNHAAAGALIGGKMSVMIKQPLDPIVAAAYDDGGFAHLAAGMDELAKRGPVAVMQEMKAFLGSNSGEWQGRYEANNFSGEVTSGIARKRSYFRPSTLIEQAADPLQKSEMISAALPNYLAAKSAARAALGIEPTDYSIHEQNPDWVDHVVNGWERKTVRGSNSSNGMELSGALRYAKQNPLAALVTNFYNQAGKVYSIFPMATDAFNRGDYPRAGKLAASGLAAVLAEATLNTAMSLGQKEKKDQSFAQRTFGRFVSGIVSLFPVGGQEIAGQVINPAFGLARGGDNPVLLADLATGAIQGVAKLAAGMNADAQTKLKPEDSYKAWIDLGYSAGPLLGIPTPAFLDLAKRIQAGTPFPGVEPAEQTGGGVSIPHHKGSHKMGVL